MKIMAERSKILFSDSLILEMKRDYNEKEVDDMLSILYFSGILIRVDVTQKEFHTSRMLSQERGIPFIDCLNAVLARNKGAILVSQDRHFEKLSDITRTVRPQDII